MLEGRVRSQDRVVRLDDRGGRLGRRVDAKFELALLAVVDRETLHEQGAKAGTRAAAKRVEHEEALKTHAIVGDTADLFEDPLNQLLADCVMTTCVVVGRVLLARHHVLRVKQVAVRAGADLIDHVGLEVTVDGAGDVFALA